MDAAHRGDAQRRLSYVLVAAAAAVVLALLPLLSGLVGAAVLYVCTRPVHRWLKRALPSSIAALIIAVGMLFVLLIPGTWLVSTIVSEATDALRSLQANGALGRLTNTRLGDVDVGKQIVAAGAAILSWLSGRAFALFGSVTAAILNLIVALFGLYYLLVDGESIWSRVERVLPVSRRVADLLTGRFVDVTEALLLGTVLTAALQGTVVGIGFSLVGLQPAILWGFVTACVSVLPLLGSAIVWLPGVVVLFMQHRLGAAIFLAILGAGITSNLDNLIRLVVYRRVSGIHPMLTLVGAFAGVHAVGVSGVFLGPLALSYFVELLRGYEDLSSSQP